MRLKTALFVMLAMVLARSSGAAPLLGDWTQGFRTDYAENNIQLWDPGTYSFQPDLHALWAPVSGAPAGPTMYVNGRDDTPSLVWAKTFTSADDADLTFSAWLGNVCCLASDGAAPILRWMLNGSLLLSAVTDGPGVMQLYSAAFRADAGTTYELALWNDNTLFLGNDFAVSGVDVSPVPEPASLILLGTGITALVSRARRRQSSRS